MRAKHRDRQTELAGEMTHPARFSLDRRGALVTPFSPVSFKPPQNDKSLYTDADGKL